MNYRREIDGLRAVAVVPVILFHAGFEVFSGGFVGVDVFFVISGYLITSIIINQLAEGSFSLLKFYERRARRILPALFLVVLCCLPFAWLWMSPPQLVDFSQSVVAVSIFVSNVLFWRKSGYFDAPASDMPLLHTWSLAVEEQYYIAFPLFVLLLWRFGPRRVLMAISAIALASLLLAEWGSRHEPFANFYLSPTRAWELFAGSICAFLQFGRPQKRQELLAAAGLALIVFSILVYDARTPFPSLYALAPVGGTALIILFGDQRTWTARLLSNRVFVGIGLISYSAYLWHQPLFAFANVRLGTPGSAVMMALAAASIVLAYFSWRFVEQPFRYGQRARRSAPLAVLGVSGAAALAFFVVGVVGHQEKGFPSRTSPGGFRYADAKFVLPNRGLAAECSEEFTLSPKCRTGENPEIAIWGDSFAMHLVQGILASNPAASVVQMTNSGCAPILGLAKFSPGGPLTEARARDCLDFNNKVIAWLGDNESVKYVVWSSVLNYLDNAKYDLLFPDGRVAKPSVELIRANLVATLETLRQMGKVPVIISPPPRNGENLGRCLQSAMFLDRSLTSCDFPPEKFNNETLLSLELLSPLQGSYPVVSLIDALCENGVCHTALDKTPVYVDEGHLSEEGSAELGRRLGLYDLIVVARKASSS